MHSHKQGGSMQISYRQFLGLEFNPQPSITLFKFLDVFFFYQRFIFKCIISVYRNMSGVSASALCQLTSCDSEPIESSCRNWMAGYFSPLSLNLNTRRKQHERVEPPVQCEPQPQLPPFLDFCVLGSVRSRSCQCRK